MKSPFKFLDPFELNDKDYFFGRTEEIDELYNMVFKTPLLLVYGLSGTGKTSLIQCGLASRFAGPNWFPFKIRRGKNINESVHQVLASAFPEGEKPKRSLLENVHFLFRHHLRPVYLIFDQFEELFILGDREEQIAFARSIRELIDAEIPCKVILVMREEFHGQLYYLEKEIPSIYDFRLRVEPMGIKKVNEVILGSFEKFNISLEDPEENLERIYTNISGGRSGIQLPYLQVYLDMLWWEDFVRTYPDNPPDNPAPPLEFTSREIEDFGKIEDVLDRFLKEQEIELQKALSDRFPAIRLNAVRKIFNVFVSDKGTKRPIQFIRQDGDLILEAPEDRPLPVLEPAAWTFALMYLQKARLLRERDGTLELAHDSLAALIDQDRNDEERKHNEIRNRLRNAYKEFQLSEGAEYVPSKKLIQDVEEFKESLSLSAELRDFFLFCKKEDEAREAARLEDARQKARAEEIVRRAEEEARLRQLAEKRRKLASRFAIVAVFLAILAGAFGFSALSQRETALKEKDLAKKSSEVADSLRLVAKMKADTATQQRILADSLRNKAEEKATEADQQRKLAEKNEKKAQQALAEKKKEQEAKERLQITAKADIVESFLSAGECDLALAALNDLLSISKRYPDDSAIQETANRLQERVDHCHK
jgi:hypothetical protein